MLKYDSIDVSEGIDINKTNDLRECIISFNDVATVSVKGNDYRIHFWYISKDEPINVLKNADLTEKSRTL